MGEKTKLAVSPAIQVGGSLFTPEQLAKIGTVVGSDAKMRNTFNIYVGGEPKGIKASMGRPLVSGVTEDRLVPVVSTIIDFYKEQTKGKEKFSKFVDRITMEQLKQLVA